MALLLAPYNEAMRLGMGFNSYTQQLCVNDVVQRPGGVKATERDLRSQDPAKGLPVGTTQATTAQQAADLSKAEGTSVYKRRMDGQSNVSQVVSWEAGFTDNLSDVSNSLNISGALQITCAAIGGGGGAEAHFVDTTKFINSDARYNITVKVTNQKLVAEDVTVFTPIPNVPASKFGEIYGDCFISGFMEGGVLSALVLKKLVDKSNKKDMGGKLNVKVDVKVAQIEGEAKGDKVDESKEKHEETSISISWSGGGDIKPDTITEWDIPTLTKVAMEFPDNVAICPQRTYAILTKYTSLRSFHEQTVKGSPLDYEIAGIYTSALLDAYMAYKAMWSDLHQTIREIDKGVSRVMPRENNQNLIDYGKSTKEDYDKRMVRYAAIKTALVKASDHGSVELLEEPLPPIDLKPYVADAFGLDKAQRDCRFEMIKIVREVNAVTYDPKVATAVDRNWRYVSPNVFKLLLPSDKEPLPSPEEIAKMKSDLEARIKECAEQQKELNAIKSEVASIKTDKEQLEKQVQEQGTQSKSTEEASQAREKESKDISEKLQKAEMEAAELRRKKEELEQELRVTSERSTDEVNRMRLDVERCLAERNSLKEQVDHIPDLTIHNIMWGDKQLLDNQEVYNKVKQFIENRWGFTFSNDFFLGIDPKWGQEKWGFIAYTRKGMPITKQGKENESSAFD